MSNYFRENLNRSHELELKYLTNLYEHLYGNNWTMVHGHNLLAKALQKKEHVDAIVQTNTGEFKYIEHKFTFYNEENEKKHPNRRNLTMETVLNVELNTPGWVKTTKADYIIFGFEQAPQNKCLEAYLIEWSKLKEWFNDHKHEYNPPYTTIGRKYNSTFYAIPIAYIEKQIKIWKYNIYSDGTIKTL